MDTTKIIAAMGGRAAVMDITGLTKGRLSQWVRENHIPRAWLLVFHQMKPDQIPRPGASSQQEANAKEPSHA